jgi:hypothetical protein
MFVYHDVRLRYVLCVDGDADSAPPKDVRATERFDTAAAVYETISPSRNMISSHYHNNTGGQTGRLGNEDEVMKQKTPFIISYNVCT